MLNITVHSLPISNIIEPSMHGLDIVPAVDRSKIVTRSILLRSVSFKIGRNLSIFDLNVNELIYG